ncbi:unnamed protein product [Spirodela intermedia]|uniref:V-type proton ATPase subunit S1/VOA1 transmembrane domain-containing protein n=1 Tax=Spirodela intermedia TaxID=51605 RepID=A0A7I8IWF3_SPIIN|nr:unnamed protein product [Spirodela intermedia]CAA6661914.1 unnamed protein product [Spirodela intermedia]
MEGLKAALFVAVFLANQLAHGLSSPATDLPKELTESVLSEGSWSNLLCSAENLQDDVDIALVFIGGKLRTSDISRSTSDPSLVDSLKLAFTRSNVSMAFPYVSALDEGKVLETSLVSGLTEFCGHGLGVNRVAYLDSCSIDRTDFTKLQGLDSLHKHLSSKMESPTSVKTDLVVFCSGGAEQVENSQSDGEILSELITSLEQLGAKYSVLYVSDPHRAGQPSPYPSLGRFLAEGAGQNGSASLAFCDGVCQIKSSLLEGLFVGVVLLIILISGLCCMMGIDTPSRFETSQES